MLVLASASPRRRELLAQAGFTFQIHPANIPEDPFPNEDPVAFEKAQAVYRQLAGTPAIIPSNPALYQGSTSVEPQATRNESRALAPASQLLREATPAFASLPRASAALQVLGADTTVTLDHHILEKPQDPADAARMLRLLSGRTHRVITGVALVTANHTEVAAEVSAVQFLTLSEEEIAAYIATGEPMDKAGAYAIQGRAARWIPRIEGDYSNVVGLPLALVSTLLGSF
jgi:septum formation protein